MKSKFEHLWETKTETLTIKNNLPAKNDNEYNEIAVFCNVYWHWQLIVLCHTWD